jgi:hypothetical protein
LHKTFIKKTWLAKRKAKIIGATQAQKRKHPQPQPQIELLDGEEDDRGNKAASAKPNAADGADTELSSIENN